jgi:hypothetical protein
VSCPSPTPNPTYVVEVYETIHFKIHSNVTQNYACRKLPGEIKLSKKLHKNIPKKQTKTKNSKEKTQNHK